MRFVKKIGIVIPFFAVFLMSQNTFAWTVISPIDGERTYTLNQNTPVTDGICGGSTGCGLPVSIIGGLSQGARVIKLNSFAFGWGFQGMNPNNKYNVATVLVALNQQANNTYDSTIGKIPSTATLFYTTRSGSNSVGCPITYQTESQITYECRIYTDDYNPPQQATFRASSVNGYLAYVGAEYGTGTATNLNPIRLVGAQYEVGSSADPLVQGQNTIINQNQTIINQNQTEINQNQQMIQQDSEYYDREYDSVDNINNQNSGDIPNSSDQQTTNLIGVISSFLGELGSFQATSCTLTMPFPNFIGGSQNVNICQGKDVLGNFITLFSTLTVLMFYIPLAWILLKMIYNEIRSWTNG